MNKAKKARTAHNIAWREALIDQRVIRWTFTGDDGYTSSAHPTAWLTSYPTIARRDAAIANRTAYQAYEIITDYVPA